MSKNIQTITNHGVTPVYLKAWILRFALFFLIWWVLTDGALDSLMAGILMTFIASLVSILLTPPLSWSVGGILRFIPFFLLHSFRGGVDVATRALHPKIPISPGLVDYRFRLPPGPVRVFMANTVSLLPGTLSVELDREILRIHMLDDTGSLTKDMNILENHLADIFGLELTKTSNDDIREEAITQ